MNYYYKKYQKLIGLLDNNIMIQVHIADEMHEANRLKKLELGMEIETRLYGTTSKETMTQLKELLMEIAGE